MTSVVIGSRLRTKVSDTCFDTTSATHDTGVVVVEQEPDSALQNLSFATPASAVPCSSVRRAQGWTIRAMYLCVRMSTPEVSPNRRTSLSPQKQPDRWIIRRGQHR
jgi:hypothetical protein